MNPSSLLSRFLRTGAKPASVRDQSALLDESRSLLVSRLPTTAVHVQNLTDGDIDGILAGGKSGMMERAYAIYSKKEGRYVPTGKPLAARPAPAAAPAPRTAPTAAAKPKPKPRIIPKASPAAAKTHLQIYAELRASNSAKARAYLSEHAPAIQAEARAAAKI